MHDGLRTRAACSAVRTRTMPTYTSTFIQAAANMFNRRVLGRSEGEYLPDFTQCIDHFAIHAGGYAVLKGIQQGLRLPAAKMVPSFASLRDYGNTSCSTTWCVASNDSSLVLRQYSCAAAVVYVGGSLLLGRATAVIATP